MEKKLTMEMSIVFNFQFIQSGWYSVGFYLFQWKIKAQWDTQKSKSNNDYYHKSMVDRRTTSKKCAFKPILINWIAPQKLYCTWDRSTCVLVNLWKSSRLRFRNSHGALFPLSDRSVVLYFSIDKQTIWNEHTKNPRIFPYVCTR